MPRSLNFKNRMGPKSCSSKIRKKSGAPALLTAIHHFLEAPARATEQEKNK